MYLKEIKNELQYEALNGFCDAFTNALCSKYNYFKPVVVFTKEHITHVFARVRVGGVCYYADANGITKNIDDVLDNYGLSFDDVKNDDEIKIIAYISLAEMKKDLYVNKGFTYPMKAIEKYSLYLDDVKNLYEVESLK